MFVSRNQASLRGEVDVKKSELPVKTCATCGLPFTWRKKWARCWDEVRYCSERCRRHKRVACN
ncbi:hypothetical protein ALP84_04752 [Pseudomonas cichorii]|uniref:DUF2256 domain-containing protein n=1 Tax=Pseudomonas cichorii TaxID=36746 RepID=A0A3M4VEM8_PSECI|nr:hypothetical protein ALP84_04752 [Pseudomonas cichorii]